LKAGYRFAADVQPQPRVRERFDLGSAPPRSSKLSIRTDPFFNRKISGFRLFRV
jgi:hypothetical protein